MAPRSVARGAPQSGDRAAEGMLRSHHRFVGAQVSRYGVASSFRNTGERRVVRKVLVDYGSGLETSSQLPGLR